MKRKQTFSLMGVLVILFTGACEEPDHGPSAPKITLPDPSGIPSYTASYVPSDNYSARWLLKYIIQTIDASTDLTAVYSEASEAIVTADASDSEKTTAVLKAIDFQTAAPKAVDTGELEDGPFTFTNNTDIIQGGETSGSLYIWVKWYYQNEAALTKDDYWKGIVKIDLNANLEPGVTTEDGITIKGVFIYKYNTSFTHRMNYYFETKYTYSAGMGCAISVSNPAGGGGKFIFTYSFADSGNDYGYSCSATSFICCSLGNLDIYDNDNNLVYTTEIYNDEIRGFFESILYD